MNPTGGRIAAAKTAQPAAKPEGRLARLRATNQRGMYVNLPLLGRAWVELAGDAEVTRIESAVFSEMEAMRLAPVPINALTYDACRTRLTLASAVRDPDNHELAFDTAEAWGGLDVDMINACGIVYNTVREELDPMGLSTLTDPECTEIRLAIEKKNPTLLRSYGIAKLSLYLLSMESRQSSSPTPTSSTGSSSPDM